MHIFQQMILLYFTLLHLFSELIFLKMELLGKGIYAFLLWKHFAKFLSKHIFY